MTGGFAAALLLAGGLAVPAKASPPLEALRLAWNDCQISPDAQSTVTYNCLSSLGSSSLYCAFSTAQPIDEVIGFEVVVDVQHSNPTLPDWWRLGPIPDCRHDLLTASLNFSATTECRDPAMGGALLQDYLETEPRGLNSQARIKAVAYLASPDTRTIANDTTYLAVRLVLSYDRTANVDICAGCSETACLVLNSVTVRRGIGAFGGDKFISAPAPGNANWVYWQGPAGANCSLVPVRNLTWGRVKSLYR